jgi:hypothetical protein
MRTVPPNLFAALDASGFKDVSQVLRGPDIEALPSYRVAFVCQCSFYQVFLKPIALLDRSIMAGQCPKCKTVHWGEWVSKEEKHYVPVRRF